jgi:hypothetical protein
MVQLANAAAVVERPSETDKRARQDEAEQNEAWQDEAWQDERHDTLGDLGAPILGAQ